MIGSVYVLRTGFLVRKDSGMTTVADLKGKRVPIGYSAMRDARSDVARDAGGRRSHATTTSSR